MFRYPRKYVLDVLVMSLAVILPFWAIYSSQPKKENPPPIEVIVKPIVKPVVKTEVIKVPVTDIMPEMPIEPKWATSIEPAKTKLVEVNLVVVRLPKVK